MRSYCCFFCPKNDYSEKALSDKCPDCGREYQFVLEFLPGEIKGYRITKYLGRGFYGAAYEAEHGTFNQKCVVKISPVKFYEYFKKPSFDQEAKLHNQLAKNAQHIVGINDAFPHEVEFSDPSKTKLLCNVSILEHVEGALLRDYENGIISASAATICQIAIDLLQIRAEFVANQLNHNDLHAENLIVKELPKNIRRPDAIADGIQVMAIDLGSVADESKSGKERIGDLHSISNHVGILLDRLLIHAPKLEDRDNRVALALQSIVQQLKPDTQNIRVPNTSDLTDQIRGAYSRATHHWKPWSSPLNLKQFSDHYNAQTLDSWNVPKLLVDPEEKLLSEVTKPGPQIITGMRGCGKTILLRALDIHARAAQRETETASQIINRIKKDNFVGLFASASRLLDQREQPLMIIDQRLMTLYVAYSLQAIRALLHIQDIDKSVLIHDAHKKIADVVASFLKNADNLRDSTSIEDLETRLMRIEVATTQGGVQYETKQAPAEVFIHLAERLRECAEIFRDSTVFFLLDDVSTRYLELDKIGTLLSALLFQNPSCAFKFTSEWQTIELGLKSPGRIHPIQIGRDLTTFDLGDYVIKKIESPGNAGKDFVMSILQKRADAHISHPSPKDPKSILGDVSLEKVATEIATTNETSGHKKRVYRGITCLTKVCVGDIGDVIKIYEEVLRLAGDLKTLPISEATQSECFQNMCSFRLYDLNRREGKFKNHAIAFASAAHELLVRSYKKSVEGGKAKVRLRQYSKIYVRVTTTDESEIKQQIDQLRELIDAAVFVFSGGAPRTKTKDSNPIQQFILSFRKIYGLSAFIGLADRDRFELSGDDLKEWLENPSKAKEILLKNQIEEEVEEGLADSEADQEIKVTDSEVKISAPGGKTPEQGKLIEPKQVGLFESAGKETEACQEKIKPKKIKIDVRLVGEKAILNIGLDSVLSGLGFEDRTLASNEFLSKNVKPKEIQVVRYDDAGHAEEILKVWKSVGLSPKEIKYSEAKFAPPNLTGLSLIDVAGLAKPVIFNAIRNELILKGRVLVCHATARQYYPLQEDLDELAAAEKQNPVAFFDSLAKVLTGEKGPYTDIRLLNEQTDPTRKRALLAFASAKHERLYSLLDRREYDQIEVIVPAGNTPRSKVAWHAADILCKNYKNAKLTIKDSNDLLGLVEYLDDQYLDIYSLGGANLELGLTGSKMQGVAAAVLSASRKVAQAWYLSPKNFDINRFSSGVGEIKVYDIRIPI